ncbi:MAG TPA: tRNA lysidine(34) synthetase TilS [Candidatus Saccharimonadales bacterium]|jgi:tRNA(Ile)-lysidine synthase|nr:tRNA lysidine(34) synthetase TilS [Candidatus Saccharimonadales bacterium]
MHLSDGRYVVAVSGGVDSVALLDILRQQTGLELIVAHFDHGIRKDSCQDRLLVEQLAKRYGLTFVYEEAKLGPRTSEETARRARYAFLNKVMREHQAVAIITAHHQDDSVETAVINLLRGTNRRGLSSLRSTLTIKRPLINVPKADLVEYALRHKLSWREDATNLDNRYLRNMIRHQLTLASVADKKKFLSLIQSEAQVNDKIDAIINNVLSQHLHAKGLDRGWFIALPYNVSKDILARWLSSAGISNLTRQRVEQLTTKLKTAAPGKRLDVNDNRVIIVEKQYLALKSRDR